jgi:hypothetical protein
MYICILYVHSLICVFIYIFIYRHSVWSMDIIRKHLGNIGSSFGAYLIATKIQTGWTGDDENWG